MKRLLRILLTLITGPALLLAVALAILWPRSYRTWDLLAYRHSHGETNLQSDRGHLVFIRSYSRDSYGYGPEPGLYWERQQPPYDIESFRRDWFSNGHRVLNFAGVTWQSTPEVPPRKTATATFTWSSFGQLESQRLIVPLWIPLIVTLLPLLAWAPLIRRMLRQRRRLRLGLCLACGYDLRASQGKCPECGATAPTHATNVIT